MSSMKLLQDLCLNLEYRLNQSNGDREPYLVQVVVEKDIQEDLLERWNAVIKVNNDVIYREHYATIRRDEDPNIIVGLLCDRLLKHVFAYGVMSARREMDKFGIITSKL